MVWGEGNRFDQQIVITCLIERRLSRNIGIPAGQRGPIGSKAEKEERSLFGVSIGFLEGSLRLLRPAENQFQILIDRLLEKWERIRD